MEGGGWRGGGVPDGGGGNQTIKVVTFRLRGRCMLRVFSLPEFTRLGHECSDHSSPCDGMHVCTVNTLVRKSFGGMGSETMLTPRGKHPLSDAQRRVESASRRIDTPRHN